MRFLRRSLTGLFIASLAVAALAMAFHVVQGAVQDRMARDGGQMPGRERVFAADVVPVVTETIEPELTTFGEVVSRRTLEIRSAIGGTVVELGENFVEGGRVQAGQMLVRIDATDLEDAVALARADLSDAEAELSNAEAVLILEQDDLESARRQVELRRAAMDRQQGLLDRGVGTAADVETATLAVASAEQSVLAARASVNAAEARVASANTALARARIALAETERNLARATITAGFSGALADVAALEGRLLTANEQIATLVDPNALEVSFRLSTSQYSRLLDTTGELVPAEVAVSLDVAGVDLIAIGNGTASRETERLVADTLKLLEGPVPTKVVVSEAGASVYSASELAAREFPDLDVSLRGAVSIARRLQDPLAELVKIEPQSIGVGQYQHDVDQRRLSQTLEAVVEDAVNAVGVDLNMASAPLLAHVAGLGPSLAQAVVQHRDEHGAFPSRKALLKVAGIGPKAFEQCAGFLRIRDGKEPLDASSVHPEAYDVARRIVKACGRDIRDIMGKPEALSGVQAEQFVDDSFGLPTVRDILLELEKPGRDPRPSFKTASFADGIEEMSDLRPGMLLEGTVTNVAAFGAFVDIGVHQDGLVHVSQLADRFVKDPHEVVKAGDVVKVRVTEVDIPRKRIGLTMRKEGGEQTARSGRDAAPKGRPPKGSDPKGQGAKGKGAKSAAPDRQAAKGQASQGNSGNGAFGDALREAMRRK